MASAEVVVVEKSTGQPCYEGTPRAVSLWMWGRDSTKYSIYVKVGPLPVDISSLELMLQRASAAGRGMPDGNDTVRVLRVLEYTGPRDKVEKTLAGSIQHEATHGGLTIREARLGCFPEIVARANNAVHSPGPARPDAGQPDGTIKGGPSGG